MRGHTASIALAATCEPMARSSELDMDLPDFRQFRLYLLESNIYLFYLIQPTLRRYKASAAKSDNRERSPRLMLI